MSAYPPATGMGVLVFDLDGTLVDSVPDLAGSLDSLMRETGLEPIGIDGTRRLIGHGIANLVRSGLKLRNVTLEESRERAAIARFTEIYAGRVALETRPYADVPDVLASLARDGWRMAVCTNKVERFARQILNELGLAHFFPVIAGPDTFSVGKPDPRHLTETVRAAGGGRAIFVGDSEVDIATAKAAGLPVIALSYGYSKTPLSTLEPDALIDRFADLPDAIARLTATETESKRL